MNHIYVLVFFLSTLSLSGFAQIEYDKTIFKSVDPNQIETVIINVRQYNVSVIGALKDDLLAFEEKVLSVTLIEESKSFSFTYNSKMLLEDLIQVFERHNINYLLNPKGSSIDVKKEEL